MGDMQLKLVRAFQPAGIGTQKSRHTPAGQRTRNLRTGWLLVGAMLGLFTFAVVYIRLFH